MIKPDLSKLHTKTIQSVDGPIKQFSTKEGNRERYDITFVDGYKAEYCPLVALVKDLPKSGEAMTFKIRHRGAKGDEIEYGTVEGKGSADVPIGNDQRIISMNGHPATIALSSAIKIAEIKYGPNGISQPEDGIMPSDILDNAETILSWLLRQTGN